MHKAGSLIYPCRQRPSFASHRPPARLACRTFVAISLIVFREQFALTGDRRAVVGGADESFQPELVKVRGEAAGKIAPKGVVAAAVNDLAAKRVGVKLQISLHLFLDVHILRVEFILLRRLRSAETAIHRHAVRVAADFFGVSSHHSWRPRSPMAAPATGGRAMA